MNGRFSKYHYLFLAIFIVLIPLGLQSLMLLIALLIVLEFF